MSISNECKNETGETGNDSRNLVQKLDHAPDSAQNFKSELKVKTQSQNLRRDLAG